MGLAHEKKSYLQEKANLFEIGSNENKTQRGFYNGKGKHFFCDGASG